jgi:ABC-2 type transport system ATP-binding protein
VPAIECRPLTKYHGDVRGTESVSFTVEDGGVFGLLGPNGAGRTAAVRTLLGFLSPTSGGAALLGRDATALADSRAARERIGDRPADLGLDARPARAPPSGSRSYSIAALRSRRADLAG